MRHPLAGFTLAACAFASAHANVTLAPLFSDHAVLQREKPVAVWGRADPGEKVRVSFAGYSADAVADAGGHWAVKLPAMPASAAGTDLVASGKNSLTLHDVLVGEVWLCSGQSNMEFTVDDPKVPAFRLTNAAAEVAAADFPLIRQFLVGRQTPEKPSDTVGGGWTACSPASVGHFTAVGYFFARDIFRRLGVPIGIIDSTWGGTQIESWMSEAGLAGNPAFAVVGERWRRAVAEYPARKAAFETALAQWTHDEARAAAAGAAQDSAFLKDHPKPRPPANPHGAAMPSGLFNGMINPLIPFSMRGILWYQGEANAGRAAEYHSLFAAMISDWRSHFGQGDLPFFWVQLANFKAGDAAGVSWPLLREAQSQTLTLPATGQAVSIDIGDPDNIHPGNKQEVGRRLALIARAKVYGFSVDYSGPVFASVHFVGPTARVKFSSADNGLTAGGKPLQAFEVAGSDRKFRPASAKIDGDSVVVSAPEAPAPVAVRYAWRNAPEANLFNGAGLPASPFRTDSW